VEKGNGLNRFNRWVGVIIATASLLSMLIGAVAGMTIKSYKIDDAYECGKRNEKSIVELREVMIRIDENLKYIRAEIEGLKHVNK